MATTSGNPWVLMWHYRPLTTCRHDPAILLARRPAARADQHPDRTVAPQLRKLTTTRHGASLQQRYGRAHRVSGTSARAGSGLNIAGNPATRSLTSGQLTRNLELRQHSLRPLTTPASLGPATSASPGVGNTTANSAGRNAAGGTLFN